MKLRSLYIAIMITVVSQIPAAFAVTTVVNDVWTSASTGGNSASGGVVSEGTSKAKVFIKTVINGEIVKYVDETVESSSGESVFIKKEIHNEVTNEEENSEIMEEAVQVNSLETEEIKKEVEERILEAKGDTPSFVATVFQKLINYVFSIFRK